MVDTQIRRTTTIELGLLVTLGIGIATGAVWATRMSMGQDALRADVIELKVLVQDGVSDRWRMADEAGHERRYAELCNREVELWAVQVESVLDLPKGSMPRFTFPEPEVHGHDDGTSALYRAGK